MGGNTLDDITDVGLNILTFGGRGAKQAQEAAAKESGKQRRRSKAALEDARIEAEEAEATAATAAEEERRKRIKAGQTSGARSTRRTGPLGLTDSAAVRRPTLLGR